MAAIYKYPLEIVGYQTISMPDYSTILCVQTQNDRICLWAIVDIKQHLIERTVRIYGTGQSYETHKGIYYGTCQLDGLVWHVFVD